MESDFRKQSAVASLTAVAARLKLLSACSTALYIAVKPTAVVADLSIVCAVEREVRGSIPVWEYVLQGPMSEFETR